MRGKAPAKAQRRALARITPAYAGKSAESGLTRWEGGDHPRLCGEKNSCMFCKGFRSGSPPPMRGKANSGSCG